MKTFFFFFLILLMGISVSAQTVYKTPKGERYHTATCKQVKNVSEKLSISEAKRRGLTACRQCSPGSGSASAKSFSPAGSSRLGIKPGEAKGTRSTAVQCKGTTKKGLRCKNKTKNVNGYCHQHER